MSGCVDRYVLDEDRGDQAVIPIANPIQRARAQAYAIREQKRQQDRIARRLREAHCNAQLADMWEAGRLHWTKMTIAEREDVHVILIQRALARTRRTAA